MKFKIIEMSVASTPSDESIVQHLRQRKRTSEPFSSQQTKKSKQTESNDELAESLLTLNDDCILDIFKSIDIVTLCFMANVCNRLRSLADLDFRRRYNENEIQESEYNKSTFRRVICKFGYFFEMMRPSPEQTIDATMLDKYCPNIWNLSLYSNMIDCNTRTQLFKHLKHLIVYNCHFTGNTKKLFENCSELQCLSVTGSLKICRNAIVKRFSKLFSFHLDESSDDAQELSEFFKLNSHLAHFSGCSHLNDACISAIASNMTNARKIKLVANRMKSRDQTKDGLLKLAELKALERLELHASDDSSYRQFTEPLMQAIANAKIVIDSITLENFKFDTKAIESLANLKSITKLGLKCKEGFLESDLMLLASGLPLLTSLRISTGFSPIAISMDGLIKLVQIAGRLTFLGLGVITNLHINQNEIDTLLDAVKIGESNRRLYIFISGFGNSLNGNAKKSIQKQLHVEMW